MEIGPSNGSSFACNGKFFALISIDNRLRIWETVSGALLQEFSPTSITESTLSCTCLCWTRRQQVEKVGKGQERKRKRKSASGKEFPSIVLGTNDGRLLLYDAVAGTSNEYFTGRHDDRINCVVYNDSSSHDKIFSCSKDQYIIEWSYQKKEILSKWKADKTGVKKLCVGPSRKTLLSAGSSIKLWNIKSKELLMNFSGHTSSVSLLEFSKFQSRTNDASNDNGYYFLSGSEDDRLINAWHIDFGKPEKSPVAAYLLNEPPVFMQSEFLKDIDNPLKLIVGCQDGKIFYFESTLNGKTSRPVESSKCIEFVDKKDNDKEEIPHTFFNGYLFENQLKLQLASGLYFKPFFREYDFSDIPSTSKVTTTVSKNLLLKTIKNIEKKSFEIAKQKNSHVLRNQYLNPSKSTPCELNLDENANEKNIPPKEKPKLQMRSMQGTSTSCNSASAVTFSSVLIQNLQASDYEAVSEILINQKLTESVVLKSIQRIPFALTFKLLEIIIEELNKCPERIITNLGVWVRALLSAQLSGLIISKDEKVRDLLEILFGLLKDHVGIYSKLVKLQGKIDLLITYVDNKQDSMASDVVESSVVVFNDDDNDDDDDDDFQALFDEMDDGDEMSEEKEDENMEEEDFDSQNNGNRSLRNNDSESNNSDSDINEEDLVALT